MEDFKKEGRKRKNMSFDSELLPKATPESHGKKKKQRLTEGFYAVKT